MQRDPAEVRYRHTLSELADERAMALGRTGRRFEDSLALCAELLTRLDSADPPARSESDQAALLEEYRAACQDSQRLRRDYCIQREALGLYDLSYVDRFYPYPPRR